MARVTIRSMVTGDLGYCCLWFFFNRYKQTALIAARLGVTTRAIKYQKVAVRTGCELCEGKENCMKKQLWIRRIKD